MELVHVVCVHLCVYLSLALLLALLRVWDMVPMANGGFLRRFLSRVAALKNRDPRWEDLLCVCVCVCVCSLPVLMA